MKLNSRLLTVCLCAICISAGRSETDVDPHPWGDPTPEQKKKFQEEHEALRKEWPDHLITAHVPKTPEGAYQNVLAAKLGYNLPFTARMVVRPSFAPEYSLIIQEKTDATPDHPERYSATWIKATRNICYSVQEDEGKKPYPVETETLVTPLPTPLGLRLAALWEEMIRRASLPAEYGPGVDGVVIEFSTSTGSGEIWSPVEGNSPAMLSEVGEAVLKYCRVVDLKKKPDSPSPEELPYPAPEDPSDISRYKMREWHEIQEATKRTPEEALKEIEAKASILEKHLKDHPAK